ncbi:hypothetical protein BJV78DRAFT_1283847 [Lactifluus subvellereus]|nr:hypothetical protein BJV78DRAFT_1283847 [Lactifluus subvellereus]
MTARRSFHYTAGAELSITRINRLLRPLRNKCGILASATSRPSGSAAPITYGCSSSPSLETRVPPSLDVLRDPRLVVSRAHQESRSLDALARQIYAVTNAYRNVVQAALPNDVSTSHRQVLALTDTCAALVGRNIQAEVARCLTTLEEPDEAEETALVDELYESVPTQFRRWTLVAHATSVIVDTCPNHPMLMLSLLGVALAHGLLTESKIFLRLFLTAMIRSPRHGVPPAIAHPMYPSYLVELCFEWTHLASEPRAGAFTHRAFVAVTLEVLMEHGPTTAWTCKSITRLAQLLRTRDFGCFLGFLHGLIETLAARPRHAVHDRDESRALFARLAKWTGVITSDFFAVGDGEGSGAAPVRADQFYSIVDILASAYDAGLHLSTATDDGTDYLRDPQAALVCAATHCLSAPLFPMVGAPRRNAILALLREVPPNPSTFDDTFADRPLARLRVLAGALRAHNLGALESALWACAVERSSRARGGADVDPALRAALVDAAEREREREDVVGSWVRQTASSTRSPLRKRARREPETAPGRTWRRRSWRVPPPSCCSSTSLSAASTPVLSSAPSSSSSARSLSGSPAPGEAVVWASEDEETGRSAASSCAAARRTSAKFKSVLADALSTRMDLKAERRRASLRAGLVCSRRGRAMSSESGEEGATCALPSEGDVLDMFAYDGHF